jgi:uncharacterized protein (UPF0332 family)
MTPEASRFLDKANRLLGEADTMLGVGLNEAAGRTAYLAAFHVAQAFLLERTAKVFKTHNGVQAAKLTKLGRTGRDDRWRPRQSFDRTFRNVLISFAEK